MLTGLRRKFVAVIMLVTTLLLCTLLTLVYRFTATSLEAENIQMMQSVGDTMAPEAFSPGSTQPDDRLHYFILRPGLHGELVVVSSSGFDLSDEALVIELYNIAAGSEEKVGQLKEYSLRYCRLDSPRGPSYVFSDISDELATLRTLGQTCVFIGVAAFLLLLVLSQLLVGWMIRPVEESWQQQKQFVADASHELKTPLTVILTNTELLQSPEYTDTQKREFTDHIMTMTVRMRTLVEGMLDLARVDSGVVKKAFTEVDLSQLTEDSILPFEPLYFESGRRLESSIEPELMLRGSAQHLEQVMGILLDNAMKYSYQGSTVTVTLQRQGRHALLCVDSPGDDIPAQDLTKIFQRFYTVDKTRTDGSSYGLGLPIANGIIHEHGGKIWAESGGSHNRFFVRLPLA